MPTDKNGNQVNLGDPVKIIGVVTGAFFEDGHNDAIVSLPVPMGVQTAPTTVTVDFRQLVKD